eukprot:Plantae.Rhodophyta-Hildenbrandia_rubra.ctg2180.p2 GENE.Plantae.Rhodophyta-Hildenbrandia_rubra.ctg2180~~Plantae.Rhodophyta-Hildenbrandia_rubra.ctg2180.p2  ORF type:complete len:312 (+),score=58.24 Plantae.Rhodophyta-Hildenbrandia_rubra.ctg2180:1232-2167(+)
MTTPIIREMGDLEHYFLVGQELYGASLLVARYKLSRSITLSQLQTAAQDLRSKYRILQAGTRIDWKQKKAWYVNGDDLRLVVEERGVGEDVDVVMNDMIEGGWTPGVDEKMQREEQRNTKNGFLPWKMLLVGGGKEVLFVVEHCILDGKSLDVVGSDLIRSLNGVTSGDGSVKELAPPLDHIFGKIGRRMKFCHVAKMLAGVFKQAEVGVDFSAIRKDWRMRRRIAKQVDVTMDDLKGFHNKCRDIGITLNSGIASAVYEALSKTQGVKTEGRMLQIYIDMDARTRVTEDSALKRGSVGVYIGGCEFEESG